MVTGSESTAPVTAVRNVWYTYDNWGNLLGDGVFTSTWNAAGRLVQAESVTHTLAYTYNGDGVRVASAADGTGTQYVQDVVGLPQVLVETTRGATVLSLVPWVASDVSTQMIMLPKGDHFVR